MGKFIDLTGKIFGRLTVIEKVEQPKHLKGHKRIYWLCKCNCGNEKTVSTTDLNLKKIQSCGCYHMERITKSFGESTKNCIYSKYKCNAKKKGFSFELSKEEFFEIVSKNCFYCGEIPTNIEKSRNNNGDFIHNGIDRIDSNKGYTVDNAVACCWKCNKAKNNTNVSDFYEWINKVYKHKFE
jgi:hypothetical protein